MLLINNMEFFGKYRYRDETTIKSHDHNSPRFVEDQKYVLVNHGLFVVQVDTASFTNVVGK